MWISAEVTSLPARAQVGQRELKSHELADPRPYSVYKHGKIIPKTLRLCSITELHNLTCQDLRSRTRLNHAGTCESTWTGPNGTQLLWEIMEHCGSQGPWLTIREGDPKLRIGNPRSDLQYCASTQYCESVYLLRTGNQGHSWNLLRAPYCTHLSIDV